MLFHCVALFSALMNIDFKIVDMKILLKDGVNYTECPRNVSPIGTVYRKLQKNTTNNNWCTFHNFV